MKTTLIIIITIFFHSHTALAINNYLQNTNVLVPDTVSLPLKGASHTDAITGSTWTRRSDLAEMNSGVNTDGMIVYSRFSPSNSNGEYLLVHGTNSTSCYVYRLSDNTMVASLKRDATHEIGEIAEIRWDYSGDYPNRVYFVYGMGFYSMDVITSNGSPTLIHNFATQFPSAAKIINDVEGDSSSNSRYWAWQVLAPYDGARYPRVAFITYDKQTDTILGTLNVGNVIPTQNAASWTSRLPDPNMVEISPDGQYMITHYSRSYTGSPTADFAGTYFDGAYAWKLDFSGVPVRVSASETHSGWGYLSDGTLVFVSQDSSTDHLQYCRPDGVGGAWPGNCEYFMDHAPYGYFGMHFAKMPASKPGWILMSTAEYLRAYSSNTAFSAGYKVTVNGHTYRASNSGTTGPSPPSWPTTRGQTVIDGGVTWQNWGLSWPSNQELMVELKPASQNPRIWRISPNYNDYAGNYRDESSSAISQDGNKIYVTNNWMDSATGHGEAFEIDITGWSESFQIPINNQKTAPYIKNVISN